MLPHEQLDLYVKILETYSRTLTKTCQEHGLNQTCFSILLFLKNNPQYDRARDIEEKRGIKKAIASVSIEKLVQSGYLVRCTDEKDRRVQHLKLTEKSNEITGLGQKMQKSFQDKLFTNWTEQEMQDYSGFCDKLRNALKDMKEDSYDE